MTDRALLQQSLEALELAHPRFGVGTVMHANAITALRERLAQPESAPGYCKHCKQYTIEESLPADQAQQPEQEPVAWLITDENINSIQIESIQRLIDRARHAHMTDIKLRINGQDEWFQADWLKHLTRTTPPQRQWQGLTADEIWDEWLQQTKPERDTRNFVAAYARAIEAKLREKNT